MTNSHHFIQLAESVGQMADLITFSNETQLGPIGMFKFPPPPDHTTN